MRTFTILLHLLFVSSIQCQQGAGVVVQLSEQGLNYALRTGVEVFSSKMTNIPVPDYAGSSGTTTFNLKNIIIAKFPKPDVSVKINNGQGLIVSLNDATIEINLNWDYQLGPGWLKIKDSGTAMLSTNNLSVKLYIKFDKNSTNVPKATLTGCEAVVNKIDLKFSGKLMNIYKLYASLYDKKIKTKVQEIVCEQAAKVVNTQARGELTSLNTSVMVDSQIYFDYTPLTPPIFEGGYMEGVIAGEFYSLSPNLRYTEAAESAIKTTDTTVPTKMVRARVTERMLNSGAFVLFSLGRLAVQQNLTLQMFAEALGIDPDAPLIVDLKAKTAPKITIDADTVTIQATAEIMVNGLLVGNTLKNLLTADVTAEIRASISFENDRIKVNVLNINKNITILKNGITELPDDSLVDLIGIIADSSLPDINIKANEGFPVPVFINVAFGNTTLKQSVDYFTIDADFLYLLENKTVVVSPIAPQVVQLNAQQTPNQVVQVSAQQIANPIQVLNKFAIPGSQENTSVPILSAQAAISQI